MERDIELIQHIQDAFACQWNLSLMLLDPDGKSVTRPSGVDLFHRIVQNGEAPVSEWMKRIHDVSIIDMYPGLHVVIAPIAVKGEMKYYVWGGVPADKQGNSAMNLTPDTTIEDRRGLTDKINLLADTVRKLIGYDQIERKCEQWMESIYRLTGLVNQEDILSDLIRHLMDLYSDLEFAGFAARLAGNECAVTHMVGESGSNSLVGSRFALGEGFLGYAMATGLFGYWTDIGHDPRNAFFAKHHIHPRALVCFPILEGDEVLGVLFGGSCRKDAVDPQAVMIGKVMANLLRLYLKQGRLHGTMIQQLQRLHAVTEIIRLMAQSQNATKIAFMLVDMSLNIMQGKFSFLILFDIDSESDEIRIVSRGLSKDRSEEYGKSIFRQYRQRWQELKEDSLPLKPSARDLDEGTTVMEFPIYHQKLHGVLCVEFNPKQDDSETFITSLATIAAIAIEQSDQNQNEAEQLVTSLHEAMGQWNRQAYEFTQKLSRWAVLFSEYLGMPRSVRKEIEWAGLLSCYPPNFIGEMLRRETGLGRIVHDYHRMDHQEVNDGGEVFNVESQILTLVAEYLKNDEKIDLPRHYGVDPELRDKFLSFILRNQAFDQHVSAKDLEQVDLEALSNRENEVVRLIVQGYNNKQIAEKLFISEHTVKNHITNIFQKLGIGDRAGLIAYFYTRRKKKIGNDQF